MITSCLCQSRSSNLLAPLPSSRLEKEPFSRAYLSYMIQDVRQNDKKKDSIENITPAPLLNKSMHTNLAGSQNLICVSSAARRLQIRNQIFNSNAELKPPNLSSQLQKKPFIFVIDIPPFVSNFAQAILFAW